MAIYPKKNVINSIMMKKEEMRDKSCFLVLNPKIFKFLNFSSFSHTRGSMCVCVCVFICVCCVCVCVCVGGVKGGRLTVKNYIYYLFFGCFSNFLLSLSILLLLCIKSIASLPNQVILPNNIYLMIST